MTDYMEQDAERLIQTLESCAVDPMSNGYAEVSKRLLVAAACSLRTLLAHIKRGTVPEGWHLDESDASLLHQLTSPDDDGQHAPITLRAGNVRMDDGTVKFGLLCEYTDYPDEGASLLVEGQPTAPAPDHFRDAAGMVAPDAVFAVIYDDRERQPEIIHTETAARERFKRVSDQWNAHLFVKVESNSRDCRYYGANIASVLIPSGLADPAPAEVPMPDSDYWANPKAHLDYTRETLIAYGDAREAAGYARGLKSRVPLDAINKMLADCMDVAVANGANSVSMPDHYVEVAAWTCGVKDAALRGEVK